MGFIGAFVPPTFLAEKTVARPRTLKFLAQGLLGTVIGSADEVRGSFQRHLKVLDLAEVPLERASRLLRGFDHDVEQGGAEHDREGRAEELLCCGRDVGA